MAVDPPETDMQPSLGRYSVSPFLKPEVSAQIRNRDPKKRVSWNWYDTWQEEHCRAFVVAKLCKADLLQEVHSSLQKAVDTGMTFAEWKKKVTPKLEGEWLGRTYGDIWENDLHRDIEDLPETQREKLISPRRLETIYRTNMKVAHAAGQYQSLKDMADLYPYWRYCTVDDGRVRDEHMAMHNKVFRHDDPIWDTHYPPNGWNCRCYVRAMDDMDLEDEGLKVTDSRDLQKIKFEGEQSGKGRLAYGIDDHVMDTDDGWNYNPGNVSAQVAAMAKKKFDKYEPPLQRAVLNAFDQEIKAEEKRDNMFLRAWRGAKDKANEFLGSLHLVRHCLQESVQELVDRANEALDMLGYALNPQPRFALATAGGGGFGGGYYGASNRFMARNEGSKGGGGRSNSTDPRSVPNDEQGKIQHNASTTNAATEKAIIATIRTAFGLAKDEQAERIHKHFNTGHVKGSEIVGAHNRVVFEEILRNYGGKINNKTILPGPKDEAPIILVTYSLNDERHHKTVFEDEQAFVRRASEVFENGHGYERENGTFMWNHQDKFGVMWSVITRHDSTPITIIADLVKRKNKK